MSSPNFEVYGKAAKVVQQGWAKHAFTDADGNQCLVQSVLTSAELPGTALPPQMVAEIDAQLQHYAGYRILRTSFLDVVEHGTGGRNTWLAKLANYRLPTTTEEALQCAIMAWNDVPLRRKATVIKTLRSLSSDLELTWLRTEHVRLTKEVEALGVRIKELQAQVTALQNENNRLKRLTNSHALRADRRQLAGLEQELEARWNELQALPALPLT